MNKEYREKIEDFLKKHPLKILEDNELINEKEYNLKGDAKSAKDLGISEETRLQLLKYNLAYTNLLKFIDFFNEEVAVEKAKPSITEGHISNDMRATLYNEIDRIIRAERDYLDNIGIDRVQMMLGNIINCHNHDYETIGESISDYRFSGISKKLSVGSIISEALNTHNIILDYQAFKNYFSRNVGSSTLRDQVDIICSKLISNTSPKESKFISNPYDFSKKNYLKNNPVTEGVKPKPVPEKRKNSDWDRSAPILTGGSNSFYTAADIAKSYAKPRKATARRKLTEKEQIVLDAAQRANIERHLEALRQAKNVTGLDNNLEF